jgi:effector-binding domain-containing protein
MSPYFDSNSKTVKIDDLAITMNSALSNVIQMDISTNNHTIKSFITANAITKETTAISWFYEVNTNWNPIQRWQDYQEAIKIKKATSKLIDTFNSYVEKPVNMYGFDIKEITLIDTVLITTKMTSKSLPTNDQIYKAADGLYAYIAKNKKVAINDPMVTTIQNNSNDYTIMVGISINGEIPETNDYKIKKMPTNGKMFVADIKGGQTQITKGYEAVKNYLIESKRPTPAVPFELLLKDRRQTIDSNEWITRIYYPVM